MKLEINKIRLRNFLSFGNHWQELELTPGLNLILGNNGNGRSNGSGKSNLIQSIPFALYGKVDKNVNRNKIINWKNGKNCEVQITCKKNNDIIQINRALQPDKLEIYINDNLLPHPSKIKDYQSQIEEILEINLKMFLSLVHSNTNTSMPILNMTRPSKRDFLECLFGLSEFTKLSNICGEKIRTIDVKKRDSEVKTEYIKKTIEDIEKENVILCGKIQDNTTQIDIQQIKSKKTLILSKKEYIESSILELQKHNTDIKLIKRENIHILTDKIKKKIYHLLYSVINVLSDQSKNDELIRKKYKQFSELVEKKKSHASIDGINSEMNGLNSKIIDNETSSTDFRSELREIEKKITTNQTLLEQTDVSMWVTKDNKTICPTCNSDINPDMVAKHKKEKIKEYKIIIKNSNSDKAKIKKCISESSQEIKKYRKGIANLRNEKDSIMEISNKIESLRYIEEKIETIGKNNNKLDRFTRSLNKIKKVKEKFENNIENLNEDIKNNDGKIKKLEKTLNSLSELNSKIKVLSDKIKNEDIIRKEWKRLLNNNEIKIEKLKKECTELNNEMIKLTSLSDYIGFTRTLCKDDNVKQYAISNKIPFINKKVNEYLSELGHSFFIVLNNWLEAEFKGPGIKNASYGNLSGGEARGVDLSLQFALLEIARIQSGIFPDILEMDELLDSSIDGFGLEKIISIVKTMQKENDLKILLVSHRNEVSEIDIDRKIVVVNEHGYSHIEEI